MINKFSRRANQVLKKISIFLYFISGILIIIMVYYNLTGNYYIPIKISGPLLCVFMSLASYFESKYYKITNQQPKRQYLFYIIIIIFILILLFFIPSSQYITV